MKRKVISVALFCVFILSSLGIVSATEVKRGTGVEVNDGKPIIFQRDDTTELDSTMDFTIMATTFDHDGKVYRNASDNTYYMEGWSTAKGSTGVDLYHYTTADFANFFGLNSFGAVTE